MQLCRLFTRFFFYLVAGSSLVAGLSIPSFFKRSRERPSTLMMSASENVIGVIDLQHYLVEEIKTLLRVVGGRRGRDIEGSYDGTVPIPIHDVLQLQQELSAFDYQLRTILDSACNLTTIRAPATTTGPVSARVNVNERRGTSTTLRCFTSTNTSSFTGPTGTLPLDALHATPEPSLAASNRTGLWIPSSPAISRSTYLILPTISASSSLSPILGPHLNASSSNITSSPSLSTDFIKYEPTTSRVAPVRDSSGIPFRDTLTPSTSEASALETSITHASYENPTLSPTVRRTFNPQASNNVAVYFGQTRNTGSTTLLAQCQDPNVDIVILAFLVTFFGPGGYPVINFGAACGGQTPEQVAKAPGLLYCPALALQISQCQALGKPVLLSLGGAVADAKFDHEHQAAEFASTLWNLFGSGTGEDPGLRPFGQVQVDGFDIDNENNDASFYTTFATALRAQYAKDNTKAYYLSVAPQCQRPEASIPLSVIRQADFVWVQFYNNLACNVGSPGFNDSFEAWSMDLAQTSTRPKLFLGVLAFADGGSGYVQPAELVSVLKDVKALGGSNFGGVMLWDGTEAHRNIDPQGLDYVQVAKAALR